MDTASTLSGFELSFDDKQMVFLQICLGFLMFGVALDVKKEYFTDLFKRPAEPLSALLFQLLALPLLAVLLINICHPDPSIARGLLLVSVCPGGSVSNYLVHRARGNTALSIFLTVATTAVAMFFIPWSFRFWTRLLPEAQGGGHAFEVPLEQITNNLLWMIGVPLIAGMVIAYYFPAISEKIKKPVGILSLVLFLGMVVGALWGNRNHIPVYVKSVFGYVAILNLVFSLSGFILSKSLRFSKPNTTALTIEAGIHNSGLGLYLVLMFFHKEGGLVLVTAWWGIWHLISGFIVSMLMRSRAHKPAYQ